MKDLITALQIEYEASSVFADLPGVYASQAPNADDTPYVCWDLISTPQGETTTSYSESPLYQFSVYSSSVEPDEAADLGEQFRDWLLGADLAYGGEQVVMVRLEDHRLVPEQDDGGNIIGWQYSLDARLLIVRDK